MLDIAYLGGVALAGWLGGHVSLRAALTVAGAVFLAAAATSRLVVGRGRHPALEAEEPADPSAALAPDPPAALERDRPARPLVTRFVGPAPRPPDLGDVRATPAPPAPPGPRERPAEPVSVRLERMAQVVDHLRRLEAELVAG